MEETAVHTPRADRDLARGRRAAAFVKAMGGDAMDQVKAQIAASFNEASVHNTAKRRIDRAILLGAAHPEIRALYGVRARDLLTLDLDAAIIRVEFWHERAIRHYSFNGADANSLTRIKAIRLALRLFRRLHMHREWTAIVTALAAPHLHLVRMEAAE